MADDTPQRASARLRGAWRRLVRDEPGRVRSTAHAARWRWLGLAASAALAAASWGAGARASLNRGVLWPGVLWWRDTNGSPLLASVALLAMVGLVVAWWRLRWATVTVRWWWGTVTLWWAPLIASVPLYSRDLYSYAAQGLLWADGLNPYDHTVRELDSEWRASTAPTWLDTPTPYGPVWLLLARGVAVVSGGHLALAMLLLRLLAVAGVVVIGWAVADVARRLGTDPVRATWLAVACPLVGAHFVSGAHNDALMVAAVLGGFALALRGRFVGACLVVAVGAMVKVTAVVALPFIALLWAGAPLGEGAASRVLTWGRVVRCGASTLVAAAVPMVLVAVLTNLGFAWLNPASTPGKNEQWTSLPTGLGVAVAAVGHVLGHDDWREPAIAVSRAVALGVLGVLLALIWLRAAKALDRAGLPDDVARLESRARIVRAAGWALVAVVVLAPVLLPWYYLWALPVLAVSLAPTRQQAEKPLAVVATVVCFMTLPEGYSLGLTTTAVGVPIDIVVTGLLVLLGIRTARRVGWRDLPDLARPLLLKESTRGVAADGVPAGPA